MIHHIMFYLLLNGGLSASDNYQPDSIATAYLIDEKRALTDLKLLTPENFCNRWNPNVRNYLIYIYMPKKRPLEEQKRIQEKVKSYIQTTKNLLLAQETLAHKYWDDPNLRLIPYILGISLVTVSVGVGYNILSLDSLVTMSFANFITWYLYSSFFNHIDEDLKLLRNRYKSVELYWPPKDKKYEEYGKRYFVKAPIPDYAFDVREI